MSEYNEEASYFFHQGTNFYSYEYLGCNLKKENDEYIYSFRTWAPSADSVSVVGDFCGWDSPEKMKKITEKGIWEYIYKSRQSLKGTKYKFLIKNGNRVFYKGDPYARFSLGGADGASIIYNSNYVWNDLNWLKHRKKRIRKNGNSYLCTPINIYEVHLGSFFRHKDTNSYLSYNEISEILIPYVKYMGYTHVEFLPISEHPFDGSWGYQVGAYYAPTSRFGEPDSFKNLIDKFHQSGIGVIIDWVPAHFPKDAWGLYEFDGTPLYEYQGFDRQESETWGTRFFDLGREEIQSFLISNALYYFREFHIDGLRVDAVSSMIYLDYDKTPGRWIPNKDGGCENLEAISFLKKLNSAVFGEFNDVLMIAEESGSYVGITNSVSDGGLGFNLKWNMGWANDFYDYLMTDPYFRRFKHTALNFPIMYAFSENYVLPISHDEVVHGKRSLINKMYGAYEDKFKQMRQALLLMMTYPGKKLMFMGTEFAQFREWDYKNSLEWFMLDYPIHRAMREYTASLNRFYLEHNELWELDFDNLGFSWLLADEAQKNVIAYKRHDSKGNALIIVINFSGIEQSFRIQTADAKFLKLVFETNEGSIFPSKIKINREFGYSYADITLPRFSGAVYIEKNSNIKIKI